MVQVVVDLCEKKKNNKNCITDKLSVEFTRMKWYQKPNVWRFVSLSTIFTHMYIKFGVVYKVVCG